MENHNIVWVGMDTDARKNQIALYRGWDKEPAAEWEAGMDAKGIQRLIDRLQREEGEVRCVYEAGPCGYELHRKLTNAGLHCDVIAPSLTPQKPGDRVKTNRRDAQNLARLNRAGEPTTIDVPDEKQEALRDLTRGARRRAQRSHAPAASIEPVFSPARLALPGWGQMDAKTLEVD